MNSDTHPLIVATEAALSAVGEKHGRIVHRRLQVLAQELANILGITVKISQGMGAYDVTAEGLQYVYPDEPGEFGTLKSSDCLLDHIGVGFASRSRCSYDIPALTKEGEEKLREIAELCDWLSGKRHVPIGGDIEAEPVARKTRS